MRQNKSSKFPFAPHINKETPMSEVKSKNGMPVCDYNGHTINMLGSGYNCPSLGLFGYYTESSIKRAITKKLKS